MNNYRVIVSKRDKRYINYNDIAKEIRLSDEEKSGGVIELNRMIIGNLIAAFNYSTSSEDLALSVYTKAKRNLDLTNYSVTLELSGKDM